MQEGDFIQQQPDNGKASNRKSEIAILHDQSYLYVLAVFYIENKTEINQQLTARDAIGASDFFGLQMDPFGEAREGFDFTVTAANVQYDGKLSAFGEDSNFNVVWESDVKIYDNKWVVEMKIPFNSIRFPKEDLSNFRINFQRFSSTLNETSFWSPINPEVDGFLNQLGRLEGLKMINPPLNLSFYPFVSLINEKSPTGESKTNFNGGLDLKYVHNNAYTLDVSLIPDFSQAPSDDQIFNLSPFEVQFNENRQFFVEGTEIFDKSGYLYTRRIGGSPINKNNITLSADETIEENAISSNILNLIKFTGKSSSGLSIGILNGITDKSEAIIANSATVDTRQVTTNPLTNYNALVLDKALKNNSSLTFVNNSVLRSGSDYDANLTGLQYNWYNKKRTYSARFKTGLSQKYFSNAADEFGHDYFGYVGKVSGKWTSGVSFKLVDDTFDNNDFGFLSRNNELRFRADVRYTENNPKKLFSRYQFFVDHQQRYYYSLMEHEQTYIKFGTNGTFKKSQHNFYAEFTYLPKGQNFYETRVIDRYFNIPAQTETFLEYQTNRNKNVSLSGYMVLVKYLNSDIYTNEFIAGYGFRTRIGQHLFAYFRQSYESSPSKAGFITFENDAIIFGQRSVKQLNNSLTLNYSINSKLNVNARLRHYWIQVDYNEQFTLEDNGELAANNYDINPDSFDDNFNQFNIDFLAKWQFAPASEISLGYKLGSTFFNNDVRSSYFDNLGNTLKENSSNTLSLKMTYFLDWNTFRKKKKQKSASNI
ncbi:DUF5916 domain-containing protein [Lacinutrix jangbogonensis]|uniref:DUF5916 domain-containing protein n=1 Tax=Lacinutrix jangbogonensis TaxID=1469557 RepID=UPI00053D2AB9|nr:DUF5916 domain-containing protein [Lacinutrix jangbogonensis]